MNESETAKFKIMPENISFVVTLVHIKFRGYIHTWNAKKKFEIAQEHKERGVTLYKQDRGKDAAYRFVKALKIIHSIPINAETPPDVIDNIPVSDIKKLKANLYNNLASYYLKKGAWQLTIDTCKRVFDYDEDNIKAHYKLAVALIKDRNFERAKNELDIVLAAESDNKAAIEHMKYVKEQLHNAEVKYNLMVKKMFA
ncbi:hypothetical protein Zmor_005601 [Zophobas morio]|uniref:Uncharacterized protein n=2 Tax=Zophobas morio TaxID=2755281 RepID=A0AA38IPW2_9CUCU|nr:hypothetical protein Zmor_011273 [Zophobas morio]KAJ3661193.1 hypothetical protein Zmor_005601 [Zophobas morio]